jgi:hypothetical protein
VPFYSEIIQTFYCIRIPAVKCRELDEVFSLCCHHFHRWREAPGVGPANFHFDRYQKGLRLLRSIVMTGDFTGAVDPTGRGLNLPEAWCPALNDGEPPTPDMFIGAGLGPDPRYPVGVPHKYDCYLEKLSENLPARSLKSA